MVIDAITLWQPWATAMVLPNCKVHETRSWKPKRVGRLCAIHSAQRTPVDREISLLDDVTGRSWTLAELPLGKVLGIVRFVEFIPTGDIVPAEIGETDLLLGDFSMGRWAWKAELILTLPHPYPYRGSRGIWRWQVPESVEALLQDIPA